jgi:hypothetical protein
LRLPVIGVVARTRRDDGLAVLLTDEIVQAIGIIDPVDHALFDPAIRAPYIRPI